MKAKRSTKGYLYYHVAKGEPFWMGQLRFRVLTETMGDNFKATERDGTDLTAKNGKPWALSLAELRSHPLRDEELLDLAVGEDLSKVTNQTNAKLESSLSPLGICQRPLNKLEDSRNMWKQESNYQTTLVIRLNNEGGI